MKFAESFKILCSTSPGAYARALRAIGQDLATLFPEKLEIKFQDENFIVRGQCLRNRFEVSQRTPQGKSFTESCLEVLSRDLTQLKPPELPTKVDFSRIYTPEEINRIDGLGIRRRFSVGKLPDIRSLGEILRTIGRLVDGQESLLIRLSRDSGRVDFEYRAQDGTSHKETISNLELYKLQKRFYEKRGATPALDPWENSV